MKRHLVSYTFLWQFHKLTLPGLCYVLNKLTSRILRYQLTLADISNNALPLSFLRSCHSPSFLVLQWSHDESKAIPWPGPRVIIIHNETCWFRIDVTWTRTTFFSNIWLMMTLRHGYLFPLVFFTWTTSFTDKATTLSLAAWPPQLSALRNSPRQHLCDGVH